MRHEVQPGESPTSIARRYGVPFEALIDANPHKPTTIVVGRRTWQGIDPREIVNVPVNGMVGDAATDAANALAAVNPCDPANVALVCAFQRAIGYSGLYVDGKYGEGLKAEVKKRAGHAPAGCSPRPSWWTPAGQSNCGGAATSASAPSMPVVTPAASSSVTLAAGAALIALQTDPSYCASVRKTGTAVNTAIHNFKAAWNASNPSRPVPINTGNYEPVVATALSSALGGVPVPPGCGATASAPQPVAPPSPMAPPPTPSQAAPVQSTPAPAPTAAQGYSSAQIAAATAMNNALNAHGYKNSDQPLYMVFQRTMGIGADGFPGSGTMGKLRAVLAAAGIPMAPVKVYPWRAGAYDGVNAPTTAEWAGAAPPPGMTPPSASPAPSSPAPQAAPPPPPGPPPMSSPVPQAGTAPSTPSGGSQPVVVAPEAKKGLSTGAIVAGALGATALVGLLAMAATGGKKKSTHGRRRSGGAHKGGARKSAHKRPSHKHKSGPKRKKPRKK